MKSAHDIAYTAARKSPAYRAAQRAADRAAKVAASADTAHSSACAMMHAARAAAGPSFVHCPKFTAAWDDMMLARRAAGAVGGAAVDAHSAVFDVYETAYCAARRAAA